MEINAVNIILYCDKWKETIEFYSTSLNLPVLLKREWFVEFRLTDSARLSIAHAARTSIKSCNGRGVTISMKVNDILARHTAFSKKRLNPTSIRSLWGSMVFYLYDPEGNRLEFWS